jgi:hypothetical protein
MTETLLTINVVYFLFGSTIYCGTMWSLRFFFYPSWTKINLDTVNDHFVIPTSSATRFFLVVVPLMFLTGIVLVVDEWGNGEVFVATIVALLGITISTVVGSLLIIPINRRIAHGVPDQATLVTLLKRWMMLNNIRWVTVTVMWGAVVWYLLAKGNFVDAVS